MQVNHDLLISVSDNCPDVIKDFTRRSLHVFYEDSVHGVSCCQGWKSSKLRLSGIGRQICAKHVVKAALDKRLFDNFIWISFNKKEDWTVRNVQMLIIETLQLDLELFSPKTKSWVEKDVGRRLCTFLTDKRFLYVFVDPKIGELMLTLIGLPAFYSWSRSKLLIVSASSSSMQLEGSGLFSEGDDNLYDVIQEECWDIASLPKFRAYLTRETVFSCFKSLCVLGSKLQQDLKDSLVYYWIGEGLLEQGFNLHAQMGITEKRNMATDLLSEFERRNLLYCSFQKKIKQTIFSPSFIKDKLTNVSYAIYEYMFRDCDIICSENGSTAGMSSKFAEVYKWVLYYQSDMKALKAGQELPLECSHVSMLILNKSIFLKDIHVGFFEYLKNLRVLDLSSSAISTLPYSLSYLATSLKVLLLRNCKQIVEIPCVIKSLTCLKILDIGGSSLCYKGNAEEYDTSTSFSFEHLSEVQFLDLSINSFLSYLPPSICHLSNLEELAIGTTGLVQLPETTFQHMQKLTILDLSFASALQFLPFSICFCTNLKYLSLKGCSSLKKVSCHLPRLQRLQKLDLSGCHSLQDICDFKPILPEVQYLYLSKLTGMVQLSLTGCPSLEEIWLEDCSGLEELHLSGTNIKRFPYEVFNEGIRLKRLYMLGTFSQVIIDWNKIKNAPEELFYVDEFCENLNSSPSPFERLRQTQNDIVGGNVAFFSVRNNSGFFKSYNRYHSPLRYTKRFQINFSPCNERVFKARCLEFPREQLQYQDLSSLVSPTPLIKLSPSSRYAHSIDRRCEGGTLELKGGDTFPDLGSVLGNTFYLALFNNKSDITLNPLDNIRECWIERCHGMKIVSKFGLYWNDKEEERKLEFVWISNLSRLKNVFTGGIFRRLKHMNLEYCPNLIEVFSQWKGPFERLESLKIRFCARLEYVFAEVTGSVNNETPFPRLHTLCLWELSSLKTVAKPNVYFPNLKKLNVRGCPKLDKLPIHFGKDAQSDDLKRDKWRVLMVEQYQMGRT